ncbi:MAG TPA: transketolase, partial [Candidatus Udaeobacter sp.]|nr:transketolase [Candidatus Udaeobacter sp.]
ITIDGSTDLSLSEDVGKRYEAYGWHVQRIDGHDLGAIGRAIEAARAETARPSLIVGRTHIAHGSPNKQDTAEAHGAPLGEEEVRLTKLNIGWPPDAQFLVPAPVTRMFADRRMEWQAAHADWSDRFGAYREQHPDLAAEFDRRLAGELPPGFADKLPQYAAGGKPIATRSASHQVMKALAERIPELVGGSGDLASSNKTALDGGGSVERGHFGGRNLHFGVREHAMGAILNGMALHKGFRVFGSTFLIFSDYMRPSIRLAALMELPVIYVFTHDSIFLGEDGPTHQPVEHLASLRAMPNLSLIRPADAVETVEAWQLLLAHQTGPTALVLSRQDLRVLDHSRMRDGVAHGAYVLKEATGGAPELILMASGSEVELAIDAQAELEKDGIPTRVVSFPSWDLFAAQPAEYQAAVLPPRVTARLAIEAASPFGWERYVGPGGRVLGVTHFGASAPAKVLAQEFGFTVERVLALSREVLAARPRKDEPAPARTPTAPATR